MQPMTRSLVATLLVALAAGAEPEVIDKYHITPTEKAACEQDATLLCGDVPPDEDSLIACMKENIAKLSPICLKSFKAGLAKRHMT
jgi:hypothetical protein